MKLNEMTIEKLLEVVEMCQYEPQGTLAKQQILSRFHEQQEELILNLTSCIPPKLKRKTVEKMIEYYKRSNHET